MRYERESHGDRVTCTPSRLFPSVITSTPQHHKRLQNTWARSACTMGYYRPVQQNILKKNQLSANRSKVSQTSKQTILHVYILTVTALFGNKHLCRSYDVVSQAYTGTRVSAYVREVVSRPWQRQEIPWDVFNKAGSGSQRTGK